MLFHKKLWWSIKVIENLSCFIRILFLTYNSDDEEAQDSLLNFYTSLLMHAPIAFEPIFDNLFFLSSSFVIKTIQRSNNFALEILIWYWTWFPYRNVMFIQMTVSAARTLSDSIKFLCSEQKHISKLYLCIRTAIVNLGFYDYFVQGRQVATLQKGSLYVNVL